jgi:UDP-N-acetyl-D-glucosamine dehydrogenase
MRVLAAGPHGVARRLRFTSAVLEARRPRPSAAHEGGSDMSQPMSVHARLRTREAAVGVLGLGYVGLTEALHLARAGFSVTGFDIDAERVTAVRERRPYLLDVSAAELAEVVDAGRLTATGDFDRLAAMDALLICVPTPLGKTKAPDLSFILAAVERIRTGLRPGQLVVLESTTYPGTTREVVLPVLESGGLRVGEEFHLCFSPERVNPGDATNTLARIPRVLGGLTPRCAEAAAALYAAVSPELRIVSSPEAAEMVKLLENTFRAVNIGLVNELAQMCRSFELDVWEIIDAAASKPFGFMPFYPGPGLGGHCIPIDPLYLSWKARVHGFEPRFIDLAHQVNSAMPRHVVGLVQDALNERGRAVRGARILVLGVAYKRDVNDARESPAVEVIEELERRGARVDYHDAHVPELAWNGRRRRSVPLDEPTVAAADCVVVVTDHSAVDYKQVVDAAGLVVDTRNATRGIVGRDDRIVRL